MELIFLVGLLLIIFLFDPRSNRTPRKNKKNTISGDQRIEENAVSSTYGGTGTSAL